MADRRGAGADGTSPPGAPDEAPGDVVLLSDRPLLYAALLDPEDEPDGTRGHGAAPSATLHCERDRRPLCHVAPTRAGLAGAAPVLPRARVALIDACPDVERAVRLCRTLRRRYPELRLVGLLCCPWAVSFEERAALKTAGVRDFVRIDTPRDELTAALREAPRPKLTI
jgi:hypothetical protein